MSEKMLVTQALDERDLLTLIRILVLRTQKMN